MKIVTLTLNPAIDVHCHTADFQPYHENLCSVTSRDAGGKGVNISRALTANGIENLAVVILGEENGASFRSGLLADGLQLLELSVPGSIRENITLHCDNGPETRISFSGFSVSDDLISRLEAELLPQIDEDTVLTFTGSNPKGLSMERVKTFLRKVMQAGAKVVIDSRSFSLQDLLSLKPWLIKPNEEEISQYLQRTVSSFEEVSFLFSSFLFSSSVSCLISTLVSTVTVTFNSVVFCSIAVLVSLKILLVLTVWSLTSVMVTFI